MPWIGFGWYGALWAAVGLTWKPLGFDNIQRWEILGRGAMTHGSLWVICHGSLWAATATMEGGGLASAQPWKIRGWAGAGPGAFRSGLCGGKDGSFWVVIVAASR